MSTADLSQPAEAVRLYHLAREWELSPAVLVGLLRSGGLEVGSHFTEVQRDTISELKETLARGREVEAVAEQAARVEVEAPEDAPAAVADPLPEAAPISEQVSEPTAGELDGPPVSKRKRSRTRKTRRNQEETKRTTRSLYGSGRPTRIEPVPEPPKPRREAGLAPSVPSFGKAEVPAPSGVTAAAAAAAPLTPPQPARRGEPSQPWSVPAFGSGAAAGLHATSVAPVSSPPAIPAPAAPAPSSPAVETPTSPAQGSGAESSRGLVLLVLGLAVIALGALLFALSRG